MSTINTLKESVQTYQPLLLATILLIDGTVLRLASHDLRSATTGTQYGGHDYLPRIINQDMAARQALSDQGIDGIPTVTLKLADADRVLWATEQTTGLKGGVLTLTFVFLDLTSGTFSSDSVTAFVGLCDPPNMTEDTMSLTARSKMDMTRANLPLMRIQKRHSFPFPSTVAERTAALNDPSSPFFGTGYSPDISGGGFGNLNSGVPYTATDFDFSYESYLKVLGNTSTGDLTKDESGRATGTWTGVRWVPPATFQGKGYIEGKTLNGVNYSTNTALYADYVPMVYGTAQVQPPVVSVLGDPNSTRGEVILCQGKIQGIYNNSILVNSVLISAGTDIDGNAIGVSDPLVRYDVVNRGSRHGNTNKDAIFDGRGDCYGSQAALEFVVYKQIASSTAAPQIQVTVQGPEIPVFASASPTDFTFQYSDNPSWVLLDLLSKSGWSYTDIDIQTFIDAAAVCARSISFTQNDGSTGSHPLFQTSLVIRSRQSAAEYIRGLRTSCRATLVPNSSGGGKLQLFIDGTLADQQPSAIAGSNYNTAVSSHDHSGSSASGFVAYSFDESNILRRGTKSTLTITQPAISSSPNRVAFAFQDQYNNYLQDSISSVDSQDVGRSAQEVNTSLSVYGISSYDQAQRISAWWLAKNNRGNPRGDTGGTLNFQWETSVKALHLRVGQIVRLSSAHDNLTNVLVRLTKISPASNFETCKLEGSYHVDTWYFDQYGQSGYTSLTNPLRGRLDRPPYPWLPNEIAGSATDPLYSTTNFTFNCEQSYTTDAGGNPVANLVVKGKLPVNTFSNTVHPPLLRPAVNTSATGGSLPGSQTYSLCLVAKDSSGLSTAPSFTVNVPIAAGTNTNTIQLTDITWDAGTVGYVLFGGIDPNLMCLQLSNTGTPSTITLANLSDRTEGVPDVEFDKLRAKIKKVEHSGIFGNAISSAATNTVTVLTETWTTNEFAGRIASFIGDKDDFNNIPVWNFNIVSNTADTLTLDADPVAAGIDTGDVVIIRTLATTHTINTIGDSQFVNSGGSGLATNAEKGHQVRIIAGTGAGQVATIQSNTTTVLTIDGVFNPVPDATSVFIVLDSDVIADVTSNSLNNSDSSSDIELSIRIDNFLDTTLFVQLFTVDGNGQESLEAKSVWREIYVFGALDTSGMGSTPLVDWQSAIDSLSQTSY